MLSKRMTVETKPPSKRRDAQRNRARLLDAARRMFSAEGCEVGVDRIAREAGVGPGTLYRHFPTKIDLILAVLDQQLEDMLGVIHEAAQREDGWQALVDLVVTNSDMQVKNHAIKQAIADQLDPAARARVRERCIEGVRPLVDSLHAAGTLRADATAEDVAALLRVVSSLVPQPGEADRPEWRRRQIGFLLDGYRAH